MGRGRASERGISTRVRSAGSAAQTRGGLHRGFGAIVPRCRPPRVVRGHSLGLCFAPLLPLTPLRGRIMLVHPDIPDRCMPHTTDTVLRTVVAFQSEHQS